MPTPTKGPRLGGAPSHERLLIANLARALFSEGRIRTTHAKAKRLAPHAERLITFAKRGDVAARRQVLTVVPDKHVVHRLFAEIAPRYAGRSGGYTRILKLGPRPGDNAPMALIELVDAADLGPADEAAATETGRRRFRRRAAADEQPAPEGANRAQRRAAARRRGAAASAPAAEAAEEAAEAEATDERPAVPTDEELEAAGDEEAAEAEEAEVAEAAAEAEPAGDEAPEDEGTAAGDDGDDKEQPK